MLDGAALWLLLLIFAGGATAVWIAGTHLVSATDALDKHFHLGSALGGLILLAIVTNLPEIAITIGAALHGNLDIAVGNLLGGIALQTVVLAILDFFGKGDKPLTFRAKSLLPVLEAVLVIVVLTLTIIGHQFPASVTFARMTPIGVLIALAWVGGLYLVNKASDGLPWQVAGESDDKNSDGGDGKEGGKNDGKNDENKSGDTKPPIGRTAAVFALCAAVTLGAGYFLEVSGDAIAKHIGLTGILFGATVLAASTALPELSTGLQAIKNNDDALAVGDIFGGNAFLPVLFLLASVISGKAVLPQAHKSDMYLTGLGILLTIVYILGLLFRPKRQIARMGIDSLAVVVLYIAGMVGLAFIKG